MAAEPPAKLDYKSRRLVSQIVEHVKSQGIFDQFRRDCIDELEQRESYRQLKQRVESHVATFLSKQTWTDALPKNQVRDSLRKHINQSEVLERGIKQLISQALDSKAKVFQTRIEGVVQNYIYTQNYPQNQDKQSRKHKTVDEREDSKSSSSDTKPICDISELIPVPGPPSTVAKSTETADKKSGAQESSKPSASSKGFQTVKKFHSTQGKSNALTRGEEIKIGSPLYDKTQVDECSRGKDGKSKMSRVKVESRDDSHPSPKVEEPKDKDDKSKISKVKVEGTIPGESCASFLAEDKINSSGAMNENSDETYLLPVAEEMGVSQADVTRLVEVKTEKGIDSESHVPFEFNVKVKEEKSETFGVTDQIESKNIPWQLKEEVKAASEVKLMDDYSEQEHDNVVLNEVSIIDTEPQRSENFQKAKMTEEPPQGQGRAVEQPGVDIKVTADENKTQESGGRLKSIEESTEKVNKLLDGKDEERNTGISGEVTESSLRMSSASDHDIHSGIVKDVEELQSEARPEVIEVITTTDEIQRENLTGEGQKLLSRQKVDLVETETGLGKSGLTAPPASAEDFGQASSTGEYSDGESDISEVSSVHTSDLSSFDEKISSLSESYDEDENNDETREGSVAEKRQLETDDDKERTSVEQDSNAPLRRRSTRISSRRSTKEGESETSDNEASRTENRKSSHRRRHGAKRSKEPRPKTDKGESASGVDKPRRRGRPRKDERRMSSHSGGQIRRSRTNDQERRSTSEKSGNDSRSTRSQRQIKRTRCYSPSSEGTREVFLPRKRSRDDPI